MFKGYFMCSIYHHAVLLELKFHNAANSWKKQLEELNDLSIKLIHKHLLRKGPLKMKSPSNH